MGKDVIKKPSIEEVKFQKIKLLSNGAKGLKLKYGYLFSEKGHTYMKRIDLECEIPPHDDLVRDMQAIRPIVAKLENIDYGRKLLAIVGFEPTPLQQKLTEATVMEAIKTIDITGINISQKKTAEGIIISYNKENEQEATTGHVTSWINLEFNENGIEEDLRDLVEALKVHAYNYAYNSIYADFEQLAIEMPGDDEEEEVKEVKAKSAKDNK